MLASPRRLRPRPRTRLRKARPLSQEHPGEPPGCFFRNGFIQDASVCVMWWEVSHDTQIHACVRLRRDPCALSRGPRSGRAAQSIVPSPADDSGQCRLGAGVGVQYRRGRGYALRGYAAAELNESKVGQPIRRRVLPGVALAGGFLKAPGLVPRRETQRACLDQADRLQVDRPRAVEARDPIPEHATRIHDRVDEELHSADDRSVSRPCCTRGLLFETSSD